MKVSLVTILLSSRILTKMIMIKALVWSSQPMIEASPFSIEDFPRDLNAHQLAGDRGDEEERRRAEHHEAASGVQVVRKPVEGRNKYIDVYVRVLVDVLLIEEHKRDRGADLKGVPEMGWGIDPTAAGGVAPPRRSRAGVASGRQHFDTIRIIALVNDENTPSIRVAEKCGFKEFKRDLSAGRPAFISTESS